ncbi:photosystem II biogenesis protein Psp29 [Tumidithrix elongata RA019]|uniref:Protein Thf1 n=1 Tax=Tumidithrix elongata BACA0141 TaxID=2716417 RepID=A0AAW9PXQ2_9CYAN|nr:photosystem II biogenesis protein Psp29 [Tumidithrix elongata RA019]
MNTVRTVSDTKRDFYRGFPKPVNSIYRRVIDELLVEIHLLIVSQPFAYDSIFGLGVVTSFDRFTVGYSPEADRHTIFTALAQALHFNPEQLRQEASQLSELAMRSPAEVKSLLTTLEANVNLDPLMPQVRAIAANPKFKYSRLFAVGIFTLLEIVDPEAIADNDKRQDLIKQVGEALKIGSERLFKDLDLYRSNLEKVAQARQMMADLVEAEKKKRQRQAEQNTSKAETTPESQESPST